MGVDDLYRHLVETHGLKIPRAEFMDRSDRVARSVYEERVALAPGFLDLLADLDRRGVPAAVASSSPARWIALVLERFALRPRFRAVVSADDAAGRTKPFPDIYLEAVRRLALPPADCLAIEDSAIGLRAAKSAGLRAAALRTPHNAEQDLSGADFELSGFPGLDHARLAARSSAH
jgi:HAD superfamily hydrolase (TIGR01509 family)